MLISFFKIIIISLFFAFVKVFHKAYRILFFTVFSVKILGKG